MPMIVRVLFAAGLALVGAVGFVNAQAVKQIRLTEKQVQGFIAAQKDMGAITEKMQGSTSDRPDPKIQAALEAAAKKHGFANFSSYDDVAANIAMVMAGIDPQTKTYKEPHDAIKSEMEEVKADNSIPAAEKKKMLEELDEALQATEPLQFPSNVELVAKYYDKIEAVLN